MRSSFPEHTEPICVSPLVEKVNTASAQRRSKGGTHDGTQIRTTATKENPIAAGTRIGSKALEDFAGGVWIASSFESRGIGARQSTWDEDGPALRGPRPKELTMGFGVGVVGPPSRFPQEFH